MEEEEELEVFFRVKYYVVLTRCQCQCAQPLCAHMHKNGHARLKVPQEFGGLRRHEKTQYAREI